MIELTKIDRAPDEINITLKFDEDERDIRHNVAGAFRTLSYLAGKMKKQYAGEPGGTDKIESLERHMLVLLQLKTELIEPVVGISHD